MDELLSQSKCLHSLKEKFVVDAVECFLLVQKDECRFEVLLIRYLDEVTYHMYCVVYFASIHRCLGVMDYRRESLL